MEFDPGMEEEARLSEQFDVDCEMAELAAAGRDAARRNRISAKLRREGHLAEAARVCPHGAQMGYPSPLSMSRGEANTEPRWNERGSRCRECGSWLIVGPGDDPSWPRTVAYPCERDPAAC